METLEEEPNNRGIRVMTILTPKLVTRLDAVANKQTASRSLLIRQACEKFLRDVEREAA